MRFVTNFVEWAQETLLLSIPNAIADYVCEWIEQKGESNAATYVTLTAKFIKLSILISCLVVWLSVDLPIYIVSHPLSFLLFASCFTICCWYLLIGLYNFSYLPNHQLNHRTNFFWKSPKNRKESNTDSADFR